MCFPSSQEMSRAFPTITDVLSYHTFHGRFGRTVMQVDVHQLSKMPALSLGPAGKCVHSAQLITSHHKSPTLRLLGRAGVTMLTLTFKFKLALSIPLHQLREHHSNIALATDKFDHLLCTASNERANPRGIPCQSEVFIRDLLGREARNITFGDHQNVSFLCTMIRSKRACPEEFSGSNI